MEDYLKYPQNGLWPQNKKIKFLCNQLPDFLQIQNLASQDQFSELHQIQIKGQPEWKTT